MLSLLLSWRYFTRKKVAIAAIAAVALIVMMVTIVLNVMSGLVNEVRGKNQQWAGDIVISRNSLVGFDHYLEFSEILSHTDFISAVTPVICSFGITSDNVPVQVFGIVPESFLEVASPGKISSSDSLQLSETNCYAGKYFFDYYCWAGMQLNLTFPGINYRGVLAGAQAGQNQNFICTDSFKTGMPDIDNAVYIHFNQAQKLSWMAGQDNHPPRTHQLRIKLNDNININSAQDKIKTLWTAFVANQAKTGSDSLLKDVKIENWDQYRASTIAPLQSEKNMMTLVFALIAVVCSFIIFAIFHMIVLEKQKDIGIIKSCGAASGQLAAIFLYFGILIGVTGTAIGVSLGITFVTHTNQLQDWLYQKYDFQLWPPDLYAIDKIPDTIEPSQTIIICLAAILFAIVGALIPAAFAARQNPINSLRAE